MIRKPPQGPHGRERCMLCRQDEAHCKRDSDDDPSISCVRCTRRNQECRMMTLAESEEYRRVGRERRLLKKAANDRSKRDGEPTFFTPGSLEILKAVDPLLGNLTDINSQNKLLRDLILASATSEMSEDEVASTILQGHEKIELLVKEHGVTKHEGTGSQVPSMADFWASGAGVFPNDFLENIGYEKEGHSERGLDEEQAISSEEATSRAESTSIVSKRKAEDVSRPREKKQKIDSVPETSDEDIGSDEYTPEPAPPSPGDDDQSDVDAPGSALPEDGNDDDSDLYDPDDSAEDTPKATKSKALPLSKTSQAPRKPPLKIRLSRKENTQSPPQRSEEARPQSLAAKSVESPETTARAPETGRSQEKSQHGTQQVARPQKDARQQEVDRQQGEAWARESGLTKMPKTLPTRRPANPDETLLVCSKPYVEKQMSKIEIELVSAVFTCFQEKKISHDAPFKFHPLAEPELAVLYSTLWKTDDWQEVVVNLATRTPSVVLAQEATFLALLGAGVHYAVFMVPLPWCIRAELGGALKYLEQVLKDRGHDLQDVLADMRTKQIADPHFQNGQVEELARKLAGSLELTLLPHLVQMTKAGDNKSNQAQYSSKRWFVHLQRAFKAAIILKQNLSASKSDPKLEVGPFYFTWVPGDQHDLENETHKALYENKDNARVVHTILPGIYRFVSRKKIIFSRALVLAGPDS